jgi:hypothetical protein
MVTTVNQLQRGLRKPGAYRREKIQSGKGIAGSLEKQHGNIDSAQVIGSTGASVARRVERKTQEDQAAYLR